MVRKNDSAKTDGKDRKVVGVGFASRFVEVSVADDDVETRSDFVFEMKLNYFDGRNARPKTPKRNCGIAELPCLGQESKSTHTNTTAQQKQEKCKQYQRSDQFFF